MHFTFCVLVLNTFFVHYRYPPILKQAVCYQCPDSDCVGFDDDIGVGCERISVSVPVLWKKDGEWETGWEEIAVGCTCARNTNATTKMLPSSSVMRS